MISWLMMINYLKYNKDINNVTQSIQESAISIFYYFIGAVPIFLGFTMFFYVVFMQYPHFYDFTNSIIILFAMFNGDSVHDVYMNIWVI